jgi:hypothetical protein
MDGIIRRKSRNQVDASRGRLHDSCCQDTFTSLSATPHSTSRILEMNAAEDDDVKLLRASASLLSDLERLLLSLLRRKSSASEVGAVHHHVKEADLHQIIGLVSSV